MTSALSDDAWTKGQEYIRYDDVLRRAQHPRQHLRVLAHGKLPDAKPPPVVHRRHPAVGSLVFRFRLVGFLPFYFQQKCLPILQSHDVVRLEVMGDPLIFIRNKVLGRG